MRTRRNHRSAKGRASSGLAKSLGTITIVVSACASILAGACGDPEPSTATTTSASSGAGGMGSSSGGEGGDGLSDFTTSSNVATSSSSASSSSGGPKCPMGNPTGGATKVAAAFGDAAAQTGSAISYDKSGNILLAGSFSGSINFGGTTLTSAGMEDVFVAKFTPAGQLLWAKQFGDGQVQNASGIGADANGNVYVTGSFKGSLNFGGGALNANGTLFTDVYLAKLSSDGNHVWSKHFGDEYVQTARGLAVDAAGNVIVAGSFQLNVNFGGGTLTAPGGAFDGFVAKFDTTGAHQWSRKYGDTAEQYVRAVTLDSTGNVYIAGDAAGSIDFGGGAMMATANPSAFVAKLDSLGNATWVKMSNGTMTSTASASSVAVGANGDVVVGGSFKGTFDMGGMSVENLGTDDAFVALYSAAGAHKYTKTFGDGEKQGTTGVAIASNGEVFVAGDFAGAIDLGAGAVTSAGGFDAFLARLDATGCPVWARAYAGPTAQLTKALALDPTTGGLALTGSFQGSADFGTGTITAAGDDVFLVAVNP